MRHDLAAGRLRLVDARLIDIGGVGIRGLAHAGDWVYGVSSAGVGAGSEDFRLWRFPARRLLDPAGDSAIPVQAVASVPPRSEGIAVIDDRVLTVQDGHDGTPCRTDATFHLTPLSGHTTPLSGL